MNRVCTNVPAVDKISTSRADCTKNYLISVDLCLVQHRNSTLTAVGQPSVVRSALRFAVKLMKMGVVKRSYAGTVMDT